MRIDADSNMALATALATALISSLVGSAVAGADDDAACIEFLTLKLGDSYSDGWNGGAFTWRNQETGEDLLTGAKSNVVH